jgi:hypothetical protein
LGAITRQHFECGLSITDSISCAALFFILLFGAIGATDRRGGLTLFGGLVISKSNENFITQHSGAILRIRAFIDSQLHLTITLGSVVRLIPIE